MEGEAVPSDVNDTPLFMTPFRAMREDELATQSLGLDTVRLKLLNFTLASAFTGVMGAFAKGAPVRAIANSTTGADDLFWYVPASSPIHSLKDAAGKTIAYSTTGSSTAA